ncbi:MAG: AAA family ATPase [Acidobacteria bacterium]|nr:AAA family ATPase [Acidobacteriota bacterium]MBI3427244.1 AAA family ATPase [Acidobacteriota bacterium]
MNNPFLAYGRVIQGDRLVGREHEIEEMLTHLVGGSNISLVGLNRVGKSSLVAEILCRLRQRNPEILIVEPDLAGLSTNTGAADLFTVILDAVVDLLSERGLPLPNRFNEDILALPNDSSYHAYHRCYRGLSKLRQQGLQITIVLDEFDKIRHLKEASDSIQRLRELIYNEAKTGTSGVIISRRRIKLIEEQIRDVSTLAGICHLYYLKPLDLNGVKAIVARAAGRAELFNNETVSYVYDRTGGHPFLAEMMCCHIWDANSVSEGILQANHEIYSFYEQMREILVEDNLFNHLVELCVGPRWSEPSNIVLERLLAYGLVRQNREIYPIRYEGWSQHFQDYLEKCAREKPPLDPSTSELLGKTERALRDYIEEICVSKHGSAWLDTLKQRCPSIETMLTQSAPEQKREKERRNFGDGAAERLLDYLYPMDLWVIISGAWELFEEPLGNKEKSYWSERFTHLAKVRTPTMHSREHKLRESVLLTAQGYCQEILELIS